MCLSQQQVLYKTLTRSCRLRRASAFSYSPPSGAPQCRTESVVFCFFVPVLFAFLRIVWERNDASERARLEHLSKCTHNRTTVSIENRSETIQNANTADKFTFFCWPVSFFPVMSRVCPRIGAISANRPLEP